MIPARVVARSQAVRTGYTSRVSQLGLSFKISLCLIFEIGSCYMAQTGLKLVSPLPSALSVGATDLCHHFRLLSLNFNKSRRLGLGRAGPVVGTIEPREWRARQLSPLDLSPVLLPSLPRLSCGTFPTSFAEDLFLDGGRKPPSTVLSYLGLHLRPVSGHQPCPISQRRKLRVEEVWPAPTEAPSFLCFGRPLYEVQGSSHTE